ncbi:MAG TPA: class I SAM-dependent RNA methyltransferase [Acidobacteriota bacterium]|nr:class I SAM-dependent RNA methyltransferase [Acidobacteriota bacterium]
MSGTTIRIEKLIYGGMGLGRHRGQVVFVPFSVPGDELLVRTVEKKKNYLRAEIIDILTPGDGRIEPFCPHFTRCGGCCWQHLDYVRQVETKRLILEELLHHRFPQTGNIPITMKACLQPFPYRSRARIQLRRFGTDTSAGFFRRGSHRVEDVEYCPLFRPTLDTALQAVRRMLRDTAAVLSPREVDIASSEEDGAWDAAIPGSDSVQAAAISPDIDGKTTCALRKTVGAFSYIFSAAVFFQANDFMVDELAAEVAASAETAGSGAALDLYSGVGLFSLPLARRFGKVIAVESSLAAAGFCSANSDNAGFENIRAVHADVSSWIESADGASRYDCIVLDPPRAGAGSDVMKRIGELSPETILYVSCDPQTLIRDLAGISPHDYRIDAVEGLDMFPQTYHIETVVRLTRMR